MSQIGEIETGAASQSPCPSVAEAWARVLKEGGYEPPDLEAGGLAAVVRYSRTWRRLHRLLGVRPGWSFFEAGCGGGQQLVPLAFRGYEVVGIDYSAEVLARCRAYIARVERATNRTLPITLHVGDFLEFKHERTYDVVFNFGVIEHFLDDGERLAFWGKMAALTRPGGYVVSVVPSGMHPLRARQRAERLGGYHVPEIDYTDASARAELALAGLVGGRVLPINLLGYFNLDHAAPRVCRYARQVVYLATQVITPLPSRWTLRHAFGLIIVGQRALA